MVSQWNAVHGKASVSRNNELRDSYIQVADKVPKEQVRTPDVTDHVNLVTSTLSPPVTLLVNKTVSQLTMTHFCNHCRFHERCSDLDRRCFELAVGGILNDQTVRRLS
jgi:hypothetical protein